MKADKWIELHRKDLSDKVVVLTGATGGIGESAAFHLINYGATLVLACRNLEKSSKLKARLMAFRPNAKVEFVKLDIADVSSIDECAKELERLFPDGINFLINNAGVYKCKKEITNLGFEYRFQTNFVGPFYLTQKLLPLLNKKENARVVNVSSLSYDFRRINFNDIDGKKLKSKTKIYGNSKRWLTLCSFALSEEIEKSFPNVSITLAHHGVSATNIIKFRNGGFLKVVDVCLNSITKVIFPSPQKASLCIIDAMFASPSTFVWTGPRRFLQIWGSPKQRKMKNNEQVTLEMEHAYKTINEIIENF